MLSLGIGYSVPAMNTATESLAANPASSNQVASSEVASNVATAPLPVSQTAPVSTVTVDPIAQTKARLDQLRAELQAAEADLAAKQRAADEEKEALESTRRAELAELPARYGFSDMRSFVGFLSYWHLRGQRAVKKARTVTAPKQVHTFKGRAKLTDLQRQHLLDDLRAIPETHKSIPQIAGKYGVSRQMCYAYAAQFKISLPSELQAAA